MKSVALPVVLIAASCLALSACGNDSADKVPAAKAGTASGKILDRSISDEMLPYDTLRSQAPRAKPAKGEEGAASSAGSQSGAARPEAAAADTQTAGGSAAGSPDEPPVAVTPDVE